MLRRSSLRRKAPLKRRPKRIKAKAKFHAHGANTTKTYRRKRTDYEVMAHAEKRRQERLANRTAGDLMFADILRALDAWFVPEKLFQNGDRYIIADYFLPVHKLVIEVDGSSHDERGDYDAGRNRWLLEKHGIRSFRFSNEEVLTKPLEVKERISRMFMKPTAIPAVSQLAAACARQIVGALRPSGE